MSEEKQQHQQQQQQKLRKSTRSTRFKSKVSSNTSSHHSTGNGNNNGSTSAAASINKAQSKRNRRSLLKKTPVKMPPLTQATIRYAESLFFKGQYMQVGDIVSLIDSDENVYYAQIRGLLIDSYCEKSAFLTWLIPTRESPDPREKFDPATYLIGPDEDLARKLSFLKFVMHAPSDYYLDRSQPFPVPDVLDERVPKKRAYTWVTLPEIARQRT